MRRGLVLLAAVAALAAPGSASSDLNTGAQTILVILATWGPQPYTPDAVGSEVFTETDRYVRDVSFGKAWLAGDVTPWLPIKQYANCDAVTQSDMGLAALNAAKAAGYDTAKYSRYIFAFPAPAACGFLGVGAANEVWLFGKVDPRVIEHELGHTFGLSHAWSVACETCRPVEYGDPYDVMGHGPGHYSAYEKSLAGWLTNVATATGGATSIDQLEQPSSLPQALVVHTAIDDYWFDHREPLLQDAAFAGTPLVQGVEVHAGPSPDDREGASRYQGGNVLIRNPAGGGADAILPGQTFRVPGVFDLDVLAHVQTRVDVRFAWTDHVAPSPPSIFSPTPVVRTKRLDIEWGRAVETGSGILRYEVRVDGALRGTVQADAPRRLLLPKPKRGKHVVTVTAYDRALNASKPGALRFSVR